MILDHVTSKWGVLVLLALSDGTHRWGELRRAVDGISEKMLAQTLRTLDADGLVHRDARPAIPPHVEYSLTPLGRDLVDRLLPLVEWIARNADVHPARHAQRGRRIREQNRGMTDYGHAIEFGTFITPLNAPPEQPVLLARHAEELGFEFATFQDHPYQPRFHDTWTLMSWVAAQTSRIRLLGNVHNLPLRPPAVLARSVASLDLLSGGRVELGIGAGGFWDAIEAMGGGRLTPPSRSPPSRRRSM